MNIKILIGVLLVLLLLLFTIRRASDPIGGFDPGKLKMHYACTACEEAFVWENSEVERMLKVKETVQAEAQLPVFPCPNCKKVAVVLQDSYPDEDLFGPQPDGED